MELRKSAETRDVEVGHAENSNECYKFTPSPYYVVTDLDQGRSTCTPLTLCLQWLLRQRRSESSGQLITKRHSNVIVPTRPRGIVLTQLATSSSILVHQLHLRLTSHDVDNAELYLSVYNVFLRTNLGIAVARLNSWKQQRLTSPGTSTSMSLGIQIRTNQTSPMPN